MLYQDSKKKEIVCYDIFKKKFYVNYFMLFFIASFESLCSFAAGVG